MNSIRSFMEGTHESVESGLGIDGLDLIVGLMILLGIVMSTVAIGYVAYEIRKVKDARNKIHEKNFRLFVVWSIVTISVMVGLVWIVFSLSVFLGYGGRALGIFWIIPMLVAGNYLHKWSKNHSPEKAHKDFGDVKI